MFSKKPLSENELLQIIEDMSDIETLSDDGENGPFDEIKNGARCKNGK
jgi:hypothetical protein